MANILKSRTKEEKLHRDIDEYMHEVMLKSRGGYFDRSYPEGASSSRGSIDAMEKCTRDIQSRLKEFKNK